uniref:Putative ovule protein n=1 Tax=Solanum chacoense TaxID=4108 RepID=A0A0V0GUK2_SOLCH
MLEQWRAMLVLFSLGSEGGGNQGNPRTVESYAGLFSLGAEGGGNQGNPRTVERRVRISLPGLLRGGAIAC